MWFSLKSGLCICDSLQNCKSWVNFRRQWCQFLVIESSELKKLKQTKWIDKITVVTREGSYCLLSYCISRNYPFRFQQKLCSHKCNVYSLSSDELFIFPVCTSKTRPKTHTSGYLEVCISEIGHFTAWRMKQFYFQKPRTGLTAEKCNLLMNKDSIVTGYFWLRVHGTNTQLVTDCKPWTVHIQYAY